jgi:hypothetical protein
MDVLLYDKESTSSTIANDNRSYKYNFSQFRNIVFKGQSSVVNGRFKSEMILPSDISYDLGLSKIYLYAYDTIQDAFGSFDGLVIGGESATSLGNNTAPQMSLFINDEAFISGGITNKNPILIANLQDDFGIKVTGNSIGHDLTITLKGPINAKYIANDFYKSNINDFKSGSVRYPLFDLKIGKYTATVKAWDIGNKSVEKDIRFEVVDSEEKIDLPSFAYPNPFVYETKISFEHDFNGLDTEIELLIFDEKGALVRKVINKKLATGSREAFIKWDGKNELGQDLAKGIYFYKIFISAQSLKQSREIKFGKLIKQ